MVKTGIKVLANGQLSLGKLRSMRSTGVGGGGLVVVVVVVLRINRFTCVTISLLKAELSLHP